MLSTEYHGIRVRVWCRVQFPAGRPAFLTEIHCDIPQSLSENAGTIH
jgi:hypothetical protein